MTVLPHDLAEKDPLLLQSDFHGDEMETWTHTSAMRFHRTRRTFGWVLTSDQRRSRPSSSIPTRTFFSRTTDATTPISPALWPLCSPTPPMPFPAQRCARPLLDRQDWEPQRHWALLSFRRSWLRRPPSNVGIPTPTCFSNSVVRMPRSPTSSRSPNSA